MQDKGKGGLLLVKGIIPEVEDADAAFGKGLKQLCFKGEQPFFILEGNVTIANEQLETRDAIGITNATQINIDSKTDSRLLAIEVPLS